MPEKVWPAMRLGRRARACQRCPCHVSLFPACPCPAFNSPLSPSFLLFPPLSSSFPQCTNAVDGVVDGRVDVGGQGEAGDALAQGVVALDDLEQHAGVAVALEHVLARHIGAVVVEQVEAAVRREAHAVVALALGQGDRRGRRAHRDLVDVALHGPAVRREEVRAVRGDVVAGDREDLVVLVRLVGERRELRDRDGGRDGVVDDEQVHVAGHRVRVQVEDAVVGDRAGGRVVEPALAVGVVLVEQDGGAAVDGDEAQLGELLKARDEADQQQLPVGADEGGWGRGGWAGPVGVAARRRETSEGRGGTEAATTTYSETQEMSTM